MRYNAKRQEIVDLDNPRSKEDIIRIADHLYDSFFTNRFPEEKASIERVAKIVEDIERENS